MQHHIIIDTDPGQDDALAILLALASPEIEVLGICAVAGNVPLTLTQLNARKICELAGKPDVKIFSGAIRPMFRNLVTAEHVHGRTGLDGPTLPDPKMALQKQFKITLGDNLRMGVPLRDFDAQCQRACGGRQRAGDVVGTV